MSWQPTTAGTAAQAPFDAQALLEDYQRAYDAAQPPERRSIWHRALRQAGEHALSATPLGSVLVPATRYAQQRYRRNALYVGIALTRSNGRAQALLREQFAELEIDAIWGVLWKVAQEIALYVGGGAVLGGVVGGVAGAFAGGVGAVPGAGGGAVVGGKLGLAVLTLVGLGHLAAYIGQAIPEMADHYAQGFGQAWRAGELGPDESARQLELLHGATEDFARGHVQLLVALLIGIVAYLTRGQLKKALLIDEIAASKLGPQFAAWVTRNEQKLLAHPRLQPQQTPGLALQEAREQATSRASKDHLNNTL